MDLTSEDSILAAITQIIAAVGRIDVLVNNAATNYDAPVTETPTAEWDRVMATNLTGPMIMSREVGKLMASQGGGAIVNVSSADAHLSQPRAANYDASKAGLNALTPNDGAGGGRQRHQGQLGKPRSGHHADDTSSTTDPSSPNTSRTTSSGCRWVEV